LVGRPRSAADDDQAAEPAAAVEPPAEPAEPAEPTPGAEPAPAPESREPVEMREAASWAALGLANWNGPVGVYPNRQPPWPPAAIRMHRRVLRISVQREAAWAELCRVIDCESGAAALEDIPEFVKVREAHGHRDATAYFSISRWPYLAPILADAGIGPDRLRLFIAWWNNEPTQLRLAPGWNAWAHQFGVDNALGVTRTMVWGTQDFDHEPGRELAALEQPAIATRRVPGHCHCPRRDGRVHHIAATCTDPLAQQIGLWA